MSAAHRNGKPSRQVCPHFRRRRCTYGTSCRFSHDLTSVAKPSAQQNDPPGHRSITQQTQTWTTGPGNGDTRAQAKQGRIREWKSLLISPNASSFQSRERCNRFFSLALELMEGDAGASQEAVRLMANEDGLAFIRALAEYHIPNAATSVVKSDLWHRQVKPLFQIMTHPRVVDSAVLEQQVATIYSFVQGIGGERMRTIFDLVIDMLASHTPIIDAQENAIPAVGLSLAVLAKIIDNIVSNVVNEHFRSLVDRLEAFIIASENPAQSFAPLQARKHLQYIKLRLGIGEQLPLRTSTKNPQTIRANFVLRRDLPGQLSAEGPRHDNDHADIDKIKILPTQEEIVSPRSEYLPTTEPSLFHLPGIRGRLDREFRLLREDTVGQLRDAIRAHLEDLKGPTHPRPPMKKNQLRTYSYRNATVHSVSFDKHSGLSLVVRFDQPLRGRTHKQRLDWWAQSKRLRPGGLICAVVGNSVLFCVVGEATIISPELKDKSKKAKGDVADRPAVEEKISLAWHDEYAYVSLHVAETTGPDIVHALRWFREIGHQQQRTLVEFPGVLLPAFQHTLKALQHMTRKPNIPFTDMIAPERPGAVGLVNIPPPLYATTRNFDFDLSCLSDDGTALKTSIHNPLSPAVLAEHSSLDPTQSRALLDALLRSLAICQGPPGTGKSYTGERIIKVLLANKKEANLGPIICVCYTNHALDQLLEHLHKDGIEQIVRIGSRSKSEVLENLNIRVVARNAHRTKSERHSLWQSETSLDEYVPEIMGAIIALQGSQSESAINNYLQTDYPTHHKSLFERDDKEWKTVQRNRSVRPVEHWRNGGRTDDSTPRAVEVLMQASLWTMSRAERNRLYTYWLRQIRDPIITNIARRHMAYTRSKETRDNVRQDVDLRCLSDADVIGVTTTGLARNLNLLRRVRSKVMLCEEAGEVLEAHTLTALLPSVEQAILIGDHQQLRPQIQNFELQSTNPRGIQYSLDVSLFERLVSASDGQTSLPFNTLETQRRMHPLISELVRSTLYPSLEDGGHVAEYPLIVGMKERLFWLHHEAPEDRALQIDATTTSHTNSFELDMTVALVQHLVRQGSYGPDDIAVITPYLGQLHKLRHLMEGMFEISVGDRDLDELDALEADQLGEVATRSERTNAPVKTTLLKNIRLATVDNFQGEEAKVVVVSLVRSNDENRCGFLSTPNRINVLLSRAQHGMYLIGNSKTYGHVPMWAKVLSILDANRHLGTQLELQCARHPDAPMPVSRPDHFLQFAPEGGCMLPCDRRLSCGHSCINRCHAQLLHNAVKCLESCPRPRKGCDHPCPLSCGDECEERCNKVVENINLALPCGHRVHTAYCWQVQEPSLIKCLVRVKRAVPGCKHTVFVPCHTRVDTDTYKCQAICSDHQPCGHACRSPCYQCKPRIKGVITNINHGICSQPCGRNFTTCRHACPEPCHGEEKCSPCSAPCEVRCSHSKCSKSCHEPCPPCAEQTCASRCPHTQCSMPCAAPCDWIPCSKRCAERLSCGHQCPSLCGETCPGSKYCQICCSSDVKETVVDFIMGLQYSDINLNEDPCIFPDCEHFITMTNMDGIMDMGVHYTVSAEDNPVAISSRSKPFSMKEVKVCPTCRGSLRNVGRYGRIVRRAMLDEATKKFIAWSHEEHFKLAGLLLKLQEDLSTLPMPQAVVQSAQPRTLVKTTNPRLKQLHLMRNWIGNDRYKELLKLWQKMSDFSSQVKKEEQPFQRVANFVQHAARQKGGEVGAFVVDEETIQTKGELLSAAIWLRCETVLIADFVRVLKTNGGPAPEIKLDLSKQIQDCEMLVKNARIAKTPRQEVEGHVYCAQFCAFARALRVGLVQAEDGDEVQGGQIAGEKWRIDGTEHLQAARELLQEFASVRILEPEIEAVENMLRGDTFYEPVSLTEMRAVYQAMAVEFRGTGHWYTCENGHPFTVGECGMPMEEARCPECGGVVGGQGHRPAEGVRRAEDIDRLARGIHDMSI